MWRLWSITLVWFTVTCTRGCCVMCGVSCGLTRWLFDQLPRVTTMMVMLIHVLSTDKLTFVGDSDNLLNTLVNRWQIIKWDWVGIYGHFDDRRNAWILISKCLSSRSTYSFNTRLTNHHKWSLKPGKNLFYCSYTDNIGVKLERDVQIKWLYRELKVWMLLSW